MPKTRSKSRRRQFANADPLMPPVFTPKTPPPPSSTAPSNAGAGLPYPAPTPKSVDLTTAGQDSINTARVTMSVRMRFNPLRGLTPAMLAGWLDQFDMGFFRSAAILWDRLEKRDYKLKSVVPKRKKAVARHGFEILTVDNIPDDQKELAQKQADALKHFYNNLTATDALKPDQQGGLSLLVRQMMDAQAKYYAVHEIVWQPGANGLTAQFVFCPLWWFEGTTGKLRYMDSEFQVYGRDMNVAEWLVTCGEGLMEASSVAWMLKHLPTQDALNFCERYGQPFIDAATTASPGTDDWDKLVAYVQNFGADGGGVRSQSANLNLVETKSSSIETFTKIIENMDRALTILWRGGDLGTMGGRNSTGASLQGDESEILETDDAVLIEETLANNVSRFVVSYVCGPDAPVLAYLKFQKQDAQNAELDLKIDQFLLDAGAPLGRKNTLERYGRPVPDDDEELLSKPTPPSPPFSANLPGQPPGNLPTDPKPDPKEDPELANEAAAADIATALHETFFPLTDRLQKIEHALSADVDPSTIKLMLEKLLKDFPHIAAAMQADDSLAKKLSPVLANGLIAGLTAKKP